MESTRYSSSDGNEICNGGYGTGLPRAQTCRPHEYANNAMPGIHSSTHPLIHRVHPPTHDPFLLNRRSFSRLGQLEFRYYPSGYIALRLACSSPLPTYQTANRPQNFIMSDLDLSGLITRLENLKHAVPKEEATRKSLFDAARSLVFALETPGDSIQRIAYTVRLPF